jgi:hypothetical protein
MGYANENTWFCCLRLLRCYDLFARGALRPNALGTIVFLVFDQRPRSRDTLTAVRTATESLRIVGHGERMGGACDSVSSHQRLIVLESKPLAGLQVEHTGFPVDTLHQ